MTVTSSVAAAEGPHGGALNERVHSLKYLKINHRSIIIMNQGYDYAN